MELTHSFAVPSSVEATWEHFGDIGALAECFPGAQVTSVGENDDGAPTFEGSCKVKLGPIALVYTGSGQFTERDAAARRFVVEAKGRDKRGNGTAGATVTVAMAAEGGGTRVDVATDLAITGKPAQFGRGVMQDVSDKLLGQFVTCLEQRLTTPTAEDAADADAEPSSVPSGAAATDLPPDGDPDAGPSSAPTPEPAPPPRSPAPAATEDDDALDLGAAVLPVLLRSYGKQIAAAVAVLALLLLWRRRRRR